MPILHQGLHPQVRQFRIEQHAVVRKPLHAAKAGFVGVQRGLAGSCDRRRLRPPRPRHQQQPHRRCRARNRQTGAARPRAPAASRRPTSKARPRTSRRRGSRSLALSRGESASVGDRAFAAAQRAPSRTSNPGRPACPSSQHAHRTRAPPGQARVGFRLRARAVHHRFRRSRARQRSSRRKATHAAACAVGSPSSIPTLRSQRCDAIVLGLHQRMIAVGWR